MSSNYTDDKNVEKAILSLLVKGTNPSIQNIRSELAVMFGFDEGDKKGSPNEILKVKREWQKKVAESLELPTPKHIPETVIKNFEVIWNYNQEEAAKAFDEERKEYNETISKLESEIEQAFSNTEALTNQLKLKEEEFHQQSQNLQTVSDDLAQAEGCVKALKKEVADLTSKVSIANDQLEIYQEVRKEQNKEQKNEIEKLESALKAQIKECQSLEQKITKVQSSAQLSEQQSKFYEDLYKSTKEAHDKLAERLSDTDKKYSELNDRYIKRLETTDSKPVKKQ